MSNPDIGQRIMERLAATMDDDAFARAFSPEGLARTAQWMCEDDWLIEYTTERIRAGKLDGMFAVFVFKPVRVKGKVTGWERVKVERCKLRKEARARAEKHYYEHSPKRAAKHGRSTT